MARRRCMVNPIIFFHHTRKSNYPTLGTSKHKTRLVPTNHPNHLSRTHWAYRYHRAMQALSTSAPASSLKHTQRHELCLPQDHERCLDIRHQRPTRPHKPVGIQAQTTSRRCTDDAQTMSTMSESRPTPCPNARRKKPGAHDGLPTRGTHDAPALAPLI